MPGMIVHQLFARRLLRELAVLEAPPFPVSDPAAINSFALGNLGPDMGVYPGSSGLVSDLAHYVRTGTLCRTLVESARSPLEVAFAWGWTAHVIADLQMHPVVNRGVGRLLTGDNSREIAYAANPEAHVRVEFGIDVCFAVDLLPDWPMEFRPVFASTQSAYLANAFRQTYDGIDLSRELTTSELALCRWNWGWQALAATSHQRPSTPLSFPWGFRWWGRWPGWLLTAAMPSGIALRGLFRDVSPETWLLDLMHQRLERSTRHFLQSVATGAPDLPDLNLDTGLRETATDPYPLTVKTLNRWNAISAHALQGPK